MTADVRLALRAGCYRKLLARVRYRELVGAACQVLPGAGGPCDETWVAFLGAFARGHAGATLNTSSLTALLTAALAVAGGTGRSKHLGPVIFPMADMVNFGRGADAQARGLDLALATIPLEDVVPYSRPVGRKGRSPR